MPGDPVTAREGARARSAARSPSTPFDQGRFLPGTVIAGRYRCYGLLGRGGMGEVYRADDLKLGQTVALKFLPRGVDRDEARLSRFLNEVKIARQISHTNVCRVYDVGEVEGHHFISMEYVDGEDLAALLRRIGRLPRDKAVQIARQICAGLAAAHEQGVLHRDLKPANVMIDGRGRARITDFGLAELAAEMGDVPAAAGTPAYMAPEQLAGQAASVKSDLYALGLVLYELFTGQRPFGASTPADLARLQQETAPTRPSTHVEGFDPAVERVILRCLEKEPRDRPGSALAVAAALPGGDPLAAALAAGETPSPELVAEAGAIGGLRPAVAWACLCAAAAGTALVVLLAGKTQLYRMVPHPKPPDVLIERARTVLSDLGYTDPPADSAFQFDCDTDYLSWLARHDPSPQRWSRLSNGRPPALRFWYRESPRYLVPVNQLNPSPLYDDPPALVTGMVGVVLDPQGRLRRFDAVPPELDDAGGPETDADWALLLKEAGFDPATLRTVEPQWAPAVYADRRAAWTGTEAASPEVPIRIEAASYRGRPVAFRIVHPWTVPSGVNVPETSLFVRTSRALVLFVLLAIMIGGLLVARRNLRLGRGDRKSALRLALFVLSAGWLATLLQAHHVPTRDEINVVVYALCFPLLVAGFVWTFYLALEPYLRSLWPQMIVSWVRLLDGRLRDPLVGRDVIFGLVLGALIGLLHCLYQLVPEWIGLPPAAPDQSGAPMSVRLLGLIGLRFAVGNVLAFLVASILSSLGILVLLLLCRLVLRRPRVAIAGFAVLMTASGFSADVNPVVFLAWGGLLTALHLIFLFRFGLLAVVVGSFFDVLLAGYPLTTDPSSWYAGQTFLVLLVAGALAAYGFRVAVAGRPIVRDGLAE